MCLLVYTVIQNIQNRVFSVEDFLGIEFIPISTVAFYQLVSSALTCCLLESV